MFFLEVQCTYPVSCQLLDAKGYILFNHPHQHASIIERSRLYSGQCYSKKPES